jgi:hypothetical protein
MLVLSAAPPGWLQSRSPFSRQPLVQLADADGKPVRKVGTEITVAISAGGGTLDGLTTVNTDTMGAALFEDLSMAGKTGAKILTFSSPGLGTASSSVNLTAGEAAIIGANGGSSQSGVVGTAVVVLPSVLVTDLDANPIADVTVIFAVASGGGSITGEAAVTDASGAASLGAWTLGAIAGPNEVTATALGLSGSPVSFIATGMLPASSPFGCFHDDQGRVYCVDPNP